MTPETKRPSLTEQVLHPLRGLLKGLVGAFRSRDAIHEYWRDPRDESNRPDQYLSPRTAERSEFLVRVMRKYATRDSSILEIGCNAGRNLHHLFSAGFTRLSAIEINGDALALLRRSFPEMAGAARIFNRPVEESIRHFADREFDIVFTMAVLEHIHPSSEWIFRDMVRITRGHLITIEDEATVSSRHFPREYGRIFSSLGMKEVEALNCGTDAGVLTSSFFLRVFRKDA